MRIKARLFIYEFFNLIAGILSVCDLNYTKVDIYQPEVYNFTTIKDCKCTKSYLCVRKCCALNYYLNSKGECIFNGTVHFNVSVFHLQNVLLAENALEMRFLPGVVGCEDGEDKLNETADGIFLQDDGRLWVEEVNKYVTYDEYCLERREDGGVFAFYCNSHQKLEEIKITNRLTFIGMIISLPFLFVTFVVYAILPLRNIHGKSLMCYIFSLFGTYLIIVIYHTDLTNNLSLTGCRSLSLSVVYLFVTSFFWMNVMCIDIWWTFRDFRGFLGQQKSSRKTRFIYYSIYAWSTPFIIVIVIILISSFAKPNTWYNPGLNGQRCWLSDGIPTFMYLYFPMALIVIANTILFLITACKIRRDQQDAAVLKNSSSNVSKQRDDHLRFSVYFKLYLAMGLNWSMEIIAWAIDWQFEDVPTSIWYVTEFCNAAFGVFIFFVFVFKKKIWILLKRKFGFEKISGEATTQNSELKTVSKTSSNC